MKYHRARQLEDGCWQLELVEVPDWALGLRWLLDEVDHLSGCRLCGQGLPDRWGYRHLAGWLYQAYGYVLFLPDHFERVLATSDPIGSEHVGLVLVIASSDPEY